MVIKTVSGCSGQLTVIWAALSIPVNINLVQWVGL